MSYWITFSNCDIAWLLHLLPLFYLSAACSYAWARSVGTRGACLISELLTLDAGCFLSHVRKYFLDRCQLFFSLFLLWMIVTVNITPLTGFPPVFFAGFTSPSAPGLPSTAGRFISFPHIYSLFYTSLLAHNILPVCVALLSSLGDRQGDVAPWRLVGFKCWCGDKIAYDSRCVLHYCVHRTRVCVLGVLA